MWYELMRLLDTVEIIPPNYLPKPVYKEHEVLIVNTPMRPLIHEYG